MKNIFWNFFKKTEEENKLNLDTNIDFEWNYSDKNLFLKFMNSKNLVKEEKEKLRDLFIWKIEVSDLENFLKNNICYNETKYLIASTIDKTAENIEKLIKLWLDPKQFLFICKSDWWKVFDEILKRTLENKTDIYTEMENIVLDFIEKQNLEKNIFSKEDSKKLVWFYNWTTYLNHDPMNLAIYIRYGHKIDHPEIAELVTIFFDKLTKNKSLKYIKDIKILPRFNNRNKPKHFLNFIWEEKFRSVSWENFERELNQNCVSIYMSHSKKPSTNFPSLISWTMEEWSNSTKMDLELENKPSLNSVDKNKSFDSDNILNLFLEHIKNIEAKMSWSIEVIETTEKYQWFQKWII